MMLSPRGATRYARGMTAQTDFVPLDLCVLTVSDTRSAADDSSGDYLALSLGQAGHRLHERRIVRDDKYLIRAIVATRSMTVTRTDSLMRTFLYKGDDHRARRPFCGSGGSRDAPATSFRPTPGKHHAFRRTP
jgi:hypothetical protein